MREIRMTYDRCVNCDALTNEYISVFGGYACCSDRCEYVDSCLLDGCSYQEMQDWFRSNEPIPDEWYQNR